MNSQKPTTALRHSENGAHLITAGQKVLAETLPAAQDTVGQIQAICSAAVAECYDRVTATTREQLAKTFPELLPRFDEEASFAKGNLEAVFAAGAIVQKGNQELISTMLACNERLIEVTLENVKSFFGINSLQEVVEKHGTFARGQFDAACSSVRKMSELGVKVAAAWEPTQARWGRATSKAGVSQGD